MATAKVSINELNAHHIYLSVSGTIEEGDVQQNINFFLLFY